MAKIVKVKEGFYEFMCPGCGYLHNIWTSVHRDHPSWTFNGSMDRPTFSPSLLLTTGKFADPNFDDEGIPGLSTRCHSFIKDGQIQFLNDCTHDLKGKTVPIPER